MQISSLRIGCCHVVDFELVLANVYAAVIYYASLSALL